jgi:hypothetical protein
MVVVAPPRSSARRWPRWTQGAARLVASLSFSAVAPLGRCAAAPDRRRWRDQPRGPPCRACAGTDAGVRSAARRWRRHGHGGQRLHDQARNPGEAFRGSACRIPRQLCDVNDEPGAPRARHPGARRPGLGCPAVHVGERLPVCVAHDVAAGNLLGGRGREGGESSLPDHGRGRSCWARSRPSGRPVKRLSAVHGAGIAARPGVVPVVEFINTADSSPKCNKVA